MRVAVRQRFTWAHVLFGVLLAAQVGYFHTTQAVRPQLEVVPNVPGRSAVKALSFGDEQFYFRLLAMDLQNSGDTFGRFTSLRYYDYEKLYHWFTLLDELDARSRLIPSIAAYYFSQTQNTPDTRYVVNYLYEHSLRDVSKNWWWLVQALYIAMHRLEDLDLALKITKPLVNPDVPVWAQQLTAIVYEKRGEMSDALTIMETIRRNVKELSPQDLEYMTYFVQERLKALDESEKQRVLKELKAK